MTKTKRKQRIERIQQQIQELRAQLAVVKAQLALRRRLLHPWHSRKAERAKWLKTWPR